MISVSIYSLSVTLTIFCKYINFPADSHPWKTIWVGESKKYLYRGSMKFFYVREPIIAPGNDEALD